VMKITLPERSGMSLDGSKLTPVVVSGMLGISLDRPLMQRRSCLVALLGCMKRALT
jgi:hypothetical protein